MSDPVKTQKEKELIKIKENSLQASEVMRKVVTSLILTVFGLAFKDSNFNFSSDYLIWSFLCLIIYFAFDLLEYLISVICAQQRVKTATELKFRFTFFYGKFVFAAIGLILILIELASRLK